METDFFFDGIYQEETYDAEDRKHVEFWGLPPIKSSEDEYRHKGHYILDDEKHVSSALGYFRHCPSKYKEELARNIVKRAKQLEMDWTKWEKLKEYLNESDQKKMEGKYMQESFFTEDDDIVADDTTDVIPTDVADTNTTEDIENAMDTSDINSNDHDSMEVSDAVAGSVDVGSSNQVDDEPITEAFANLDAVQFMKLSVDLDKEYGDNFKITKPVDSPAGKHFFIQNPKYTNKEYIKVSMDKNKNIVGMKTITKKNKWDEDEPSTTVAFKGTISRIADLLKRISELLEGGPNMVFAESFFDIDVDDYIQEHHTSFFTEEDDPTEDIEPGTDDSLKDSVEDAGEEAPDASETTDDAIENTNETINEIKDENLVDDEIPEEADTSEEEPVVDDTAAVEDTAVEDNVDDETIPEESEPMTEKPTEDTTVDDSAVDDTAMGMDTSDVNNEYDEAEVQLLNKLIASENDAIGEYFDAAKNSKDSNMMRLYSDIGGEERFHVEQLMYAKSMLTGEKYEPKDPDVKKEYEELLEMGVDEESAMTIAVDKVGIAPTPDPEEMQDLQLKFEEYEESFYQQAFLEAMIETAYDIDPVRFMESVQLCVGNQFFIQEDFQDSRVRTGREAERWTPGFIISNIVEFVRKMISSIGSTLGKAADNLRANRGKIIDWIEKNGITGLFKDGVYLYFYTNNGGSRYLDKEAIAYAKVLVNATTDFAKALNIKPSDGEFPYYTDVSKEYGDLAKAFRLIQNKTYTKIKVVVTEENKAALESIFFGYDEKNRKLNFDEKGALKDSYSLNVFNNLRLALAVAQKGVKIAAQLEEILGMTKVDASVHNKNAERTANSISTNQKDFQVIMKGYQSFIQAINSDIAQILKLNNGVMEQTEAKDAARTERLQDAGMNVKNFNRVERKVEKQDAKALRREQNPGFFRRIFKKNI